MGILEKITILGDINTLTISYVGDIVESVVVGEFEGLWG